MRHEAGQVRGVLAERAAVAVPLDPWLSLRALAGYSGLSVRRLRQLLDDGANPLPAYQVGAKILIRRSEFDAWMVAYRRQDRTTDATAIVDNMLRGLDRPPRRQRSVRARSE